MTDIMGKGEGHEPRARFLVAPSYLEEAELDKEWERQFRQERAGSSGALHMNGGGA